MIANPSPATCACTTLRKATRAVSRLYDEALAETGMSIVQFSILRTLFRQGDMPLSRLAEAMVMDRTSLYRTLGPIEAHGWVAIAPPAGGRIRIASLTPGGRAALQQATPLWDGAQRCIADAMGGNGWAALEASLASLTTAILSGNARNAA